MTRQNLMRLQAPAKINLYLDVIGKRPDGYHELVSLMCCVGIHDTVRFSFHPPDNRPALSVTCHHPDVPPGPENLAWRAAAAFFEKSGLPGRVRIFIDKQIPVGGGLGGGSSDAAAVLKGLNRHFGSPLDPETLAGLGRRIGADVPFFLLGRPAVATGVGEKLTAFSGLCPADIVLVYPGRPVSTAEVFGKLNLALTKNKKINTKSIFEPGWQADMSNRLHNALEPVAMQICPEIKTAKDALIACGASGALMSGSGSSVFGLFTDSVRAERAFHQLSGTNAEWRVFQTRLLA